MTNPTAPDAPAFTVTEPADAKARRAVAPVICYPTDALPRPDLAWLSGLAEGASRVDGVTVPPRDARVIAVPAGHLFRITSTEGPQVGDLNVWNAANLAEHFFSGKSRALHGTHLGQGDRLWSRLPWLRALATISRDTLGWYGIDQYGGGVHDVIGTRCDPYTGRLLSGGDYHYCCHSNLTRALADHTGLSLSEAEPLVHDVLNVFMCTGFTRDENRYFMKASPVRPGDYIEFLAETDLLVGLSACPGGDCGAEHSSDSAACFPMQIDVLKPRGGALRDWAPSAPNPYDRSHGR